MPGAPASSLDLAEGRVAGNGIATLSLTFDPGQGPEAAALQWTIVYDRNVFREILVREGPAAVAADKTLSCIERNGSVKCILSGWNQTAIPAGVIALVELTPDPSVAPRVSPVEITEALGATPSGDPLAISATGGSVDTSVRLELSSLSCDPEVIDTPGDTVCRVTLGRAAPSGGVTVSLASSHPALAVPSSVSIPAGRRSATFRAEAQELAGSATVVVKTEYDGSTVETTLSLAGVRLSWLMCEPDWVEAGERAHCTARLSSPHPSGPVSIALWSSTSDVMLPETITVRSGQPEATFEAIIAPAAPGQSVTVEAACGGEGDRHIFNIVPRPAPVLSAPREVFMAAGREGSFEVSATDPGGGAVTLAVQGLPAGARFDADRGRFSWVPGFDQLGAHTVTFVATDTDGDSSTAEVIITAGTDRTVVFGLANAAGFQTEHVCSPGSLASIFGANFTSEPPAALTSVPAPTELNGVRLRVNGQYAALLFVSAGQINFQCPQVQPGARLEFVVEGPFGFSEPVITSMLDASPGIFTIEGSGMGQGSILLAGTAEFAKERNFIAPGQPAWPGDIISIYATGLGPADEVLNAGEPAPLDRLIHLRGSVTVLIGGVESEVLFAGLAPTLIGVAQINVKIPENVPLGSAVPVSVIVKPSGGQPAASNEATLAIEPRP
ncbi:MAG: putative Ig domain-containing protein [Rhodospirillales bacterium]